MTSLLIKIFIKDYKNIQDISVRSSYGHMSSIVGLSINIFLSITKFIAGTISGSLAIVADAVNNLSDCASSIISLVSFRISAKPPDKEHPYGHARAEYLMSSVVALIILYIGISLSKASIDKIINPQPVEFDLLIAIILIIAILSKLWLWRYYNKIGGIINSEMLKATGVDSISDVMSTSVVLISLVITPIIHYNLDGIMGLIVAVLILKSGYEILRSTTNKVLGTGPTAEKTSEISAFMLQYDGILGVHDIMMHEYGPGSVYVIAHCEVDASKDVVVSHDLIDRIERDLEDKLGYKSNIHMDPILINDPKTEACRIDVINVLSAINPMIAIHDFRIVDTSSYINLIFDVLVPLDYKELNSLKEEIMIRLNEINWRYKANMTIDVDYSGELDTTNDNELGER